MTEHDISLNAERASIEIKRVENGWVIRTNDPFKAGYEIPLRVAETPEALLEIIGEWARSQHKSAEYARQPMFTKP